MATEVYGRDTVTGQCGWLTAIPDNPPTVDTDTFGEPQVAVAAGIDFFGEPYTLGDKLFITPSGNIVKLTIDLCALMDQSVVIGNLVA